MKLRYFDARMLKTPPIAVAQLFNEVQRMGSIAMGNFQRAMECFNEWDEKKSEELARNEDVLDYLNREITDSLVEVKGLDLSEKDTKLVGSLFHVVNDMERIGDQAEDIAEIIQFLAGRSAENDDLLREMARSTIHMVTESVDAYVQRDTMLAETVIAEDDVVDNAFDEVKRRLIDKIAAHPEDGEYALDLLMIAKYFERICDHATNIAEWVIFSVTGVHKEG